MNVSTLPTIVEAASVASITSVVSGLLALLAPALSQVPGFRPNDGARSTLMRVLLYALTLGGVLALAWSQNVVIPKEMLPTLLVAVGGGDGLAHIFYTGVKSSAASSGTGAAAAPSDTSGAAALAKAQEALDAVKALAPAAG